MLLAALSAWHNGVLEYIKLNAIIGISALVVAVVLGGRHVLGAVSGWWAAPAVQGAVVEPDERLRATVVERLPPAPASEVPVATPSVPASVPRPSRESFVSASSTNAGGADLQALLTAVSAANDPRPQLRCTTSAASVTEKRAADTWWRGHPGRGPRVRHSDVASWVVGESTAEAPWMLVNEDQERAGGFRTEEDFETVVEAFWARVLGKDAKDKAGVSMRKEWKTYRWEDAKCDESAGSGASPETIQHRVDKFCTTYEVLVLRAYNTRGTSMRLDVSTASSREEIKRLLKRIPPRARAHTASEITRHRSSRPDQSYPTIASVLSCSFLGAGQRRVTWRQIPRQTLRTSPGSMGAAQLRTAAYLLFPRPGQTVLFLPREQLLRVLRRFRSARRSVERAGPPKNIGFLFEQHTARRHHDGIPRFTLQMVAGGGTTGSSSAAKQRTGVCGVSAHGFFGGGDGDVVRFS